MLFRSYDEITQRLGETFEVSINSYKPFACGIVIHPAIDGCVQLRNEHQLAAAEIDRIALRVHPLVLELTGKKTPKTGLDGKFSVYHSAAVAIIDGRAGEPQYSDERVRDPEVVALRDRVTAEIDPAMPADAVEVTVTLKDGRVLRKRVDHAIGSVARPMTDRDLEAKFTDLVLPVLGEAGTTALLQTCWTLDALPDAGAIARMAQTR